MPSFHIYGPVSPSYHQNLWICLHNASICILLLLLSYTEGYKCGIIVYTLYFYATKEVLCVGIYIFRAQYRQSKHFLAYFCVNSRCLDLWIINENNKSAQSFWCYNNRSFDILIIFKGFIQTEKSWVVVIL